MRRAPNCTGESTKMQNKYHGPLVMTEVLTSDVYRVTELNETKRSRFATTAHVSQLKSWRLQVDDEEVEGELNVSGTDLPAVDEENGELGEWPNTGGLPPPETQQPDTPGTPVPDDRRSQRVVRKPGWMRDYTW